MNRLKKFFIISFAFVLMLPYIPFANLKSSALTYYYYDYDYDTGIETTYALDYEVETFWEYVEESDSYLEYDAAYITGLHAPESDYVGPDYDYSNLYIPEAIYDYDTDTEYPVYSIGSNAFKGETGIKTVTLSNSIGVINSDAFNGCTNLTEINYSSSEFVDSSPSLGYIGSRAFYGCTSLKSISLPESLITIGYAAFSRCTSLENISLPNSLTTIEASAFSGCSSLNSVAIGSGLKSISYSAFGSCSELSTLTVDESNPYLTLEDGALFSKDKTKLVLYFEGVAGNNNYTVPSSITSIYSGAFYNCVNLESITLPEGLKSIGSSAFYNCDSLKSLTLPNTVTSLGSTAFLSCDSLESIKLSSGLETIDSFTFQNCSALTSISIPDTVKVIERGAFMGCDNITEITLPFVGRGEPIPPEDNYNNFDYDCFAWIFGAQRGTENPESGGDFYYDENGYPVFTNFVPDSLKTVILSSNCTQIPTSAFYECTSIEKIVIPYNVKDISSTAFSYCKNLVIYCNYNSYAKTFAIDNNIPYILIGIKGDASGDGILNSNDLTALRRYLLNCFDISPDGNCNEDNIIDVRDLVRLKKELGNV